MYAIRSYYGTNYFGVSPNAPDFPNAKIIYTTSGFMDKDKQAKANKNSFEYSELVP